MKKKKINIGKNEPKTTGAEKEDKDMFKPRIRFTHDEIRVLVYALNELRNTLIEEGRYTDAVDELLIKLLK